MEKKNLVRQKSRNEFYKDVLLRNKKLDKRQDMLSRYSEYVKDLYDLTLDDFEYISHYIEFNYFL
jgi:hypothetical protein